MKCKDICERALMNETDKNFNPRTCCCCCEFLKECKKINMGCAHALMGKYDAETCINCKYINEDRN